MIDQDEIRKAVALKNGVWLGENDPILQSVTIFEKALEQSVATLNAHHEESIKKLLAAMKQGEVDAKATGNRIVGQVVTHVTDQIKTAMNGSEEKLLKSIAIRIQAADAALFEAKAARNISFVAAGISVASLLGVSFLITMI